MAAYTEGQETRIAQAVSDRMDRYASNTEDLGFRLTVADPEAREHIKSIGVSILSTKWGVGFPGGSFVQAIVNGDLMETFGRADHINLNCIRFYVYLVYNQSYVA